MSKTLISVILIVAVSIAAYFILMEVAGWTQKKAAIIAFGAGGAMILMDMVTVVVRKSRQ